MCFFDIVCLWIGRLVIGLSTGILCFGLCALVTEEKRIREE